MIRYRHTADQAWVVLEHDDLTLVVDAQAAWSDLWGGLASGADATALLDQLADGGFAAMPSFALVDRRSDEVRLIVRGELSASVRLPSDELTIDATRATTWRESTHVDVSSVTVTPTGPDSGDGALLPLRGGAAFTRDVRIDLVDRPDQDDAESADTVEGSEESEGPAEPAEAVARPTQDEGVEEVSETTIVDPLEMAHAAEESADAAVAAPAAPTDPVATADESNDSDYDHLFGATVIRHLEDAAVRPADDEAESEPAGVAQGSDSPDEQADDEPLGDHDGLTIMASDLARMRRTADEESEPPSAEGAQPESFALEFDDGSRTAVEGTLVLGRAPSARRVPGSGMPQLVTVGRDNPDVSRTHARIALEGGTVVVADLNSRNGTSVELPGRDPQRVRPEEPLSVVDGTTIDLGGLVMTVVSV